MTVAAAVAAGGVEWAVDVPVGDSCYWMDQSDLATHLRDSFPAVVLERNRTVEPPNRDR